MIEDFEEAKSYYSSSTKDDIEATDEILKTAKELKALKNQSKEIEEKSDVLKAKIISFMKDKKRLVDHFGEKLFTYTLIEQTKFDSAKLKEQDPDLYEKYLCKSSYMKFQ